MFNFCNHKFGKVEGNYQYCQKCGIAKAAPEVKCNHKWKREFVEDVYHVFSGRIYRKIILYECENCGETKQEVIG
jgi:hypothetical protein